MNFNQKTFQSLSTSQSKSNKHLSIYIPTHRKSQVQEDKIRFKNALAEAEQKLCDPRRTPYESMEESEARKFLRKAYAYLEKDDFWLHLSDMLVLFMSEDQFALHTLPIQRKPLIYVGREFYLSPLISSINKDKNFFILSLSQGGSAFFEAGPHHITPVKVDDLIPANIAEVGVESEEKSLQFHSVEASQAIYHGQGMGKDVKEAELEKYFRQLDEGLMTMLNDEKLPMLLAGVDYLIPLYKSLSKYSYVLPDHISGNQEHTHPMDLHEKAWFFASKYYQKDIEEKLSDFKENYVADKASFSSAEIIKAAYQGKIKYLFLDREHEPLWGFYGYLSNNQIEFHMEQNAYNYCLYDFTAIQAYKKGAEVFFLDQSELPIPDSGMNAIFRY
ncbi:MAG: hypothetical protein AAFR87_14365 [Bacteroidota bacterium]